MSKKGFSGFTIIETMLFLAVTAVLVVGVLAGTGVSINNQRYKDSVYSLQSYLQKQLSEVVSTSNDSPLLGGSQKYSCSSSAVVTIAGVGEPKGQSNCLILGKLITASPTTGETSQLVSRTVVGYPKATTTSSDDTTVFQSYYIRAIQDSVIVGDTYSIEWSNVLKTPSVGGNSKFSILIIKSPASGIIRTYINPTTVVNINSSLDSTMTLASNLANPITLCVRPGAGGVYNGEIMAVVLNKGASSASSVEIFSNTGLINRPGSGGVGC